MDICEIHKCTMKQLMLSDDIMDNFEYQAWVHRWHESRFGSRWDSYMQGQLIGYVANIMGGTVWKPEDYIVTSNPESSLTEPQTLAASEQQAAYMMMIEFKGKAAADEWRGLTNASN